MKLPSLFIFWYRSNYAFLAIITVGLLAITPIDTCIQAFTRNGQAYNVFVILVCYGVTIICAALLFLQRRYTNKALLKDIPRIHIPVVKKKVQKMIAAGLARSAAIAWDSRPRIEHHIATKPSSSNTRDGAALATQNIPDEQARYDEKPEGEAIIDIQPERPVWGEIEHNGWSSPTSADLPNLQYINVILELPHLIEAKAVSLAPPDPQSNSTPPIPDMRAVDILQRPAAMGLRDYISHLTSYEVITAPDVATSFLSSYEYARFSSRPLSSNDFRDLMKQFAEVLRSMEALSPAIIMSLDIDGDSDIDGDAPSSTPSSATPVTPHRGSPASSLKSVSIHSGSEGTIRTAPSRRRDTYHTTSVRNSHVSTIFSTPRSMKRVASISPSQPRRTYTGSSSSSSIRSAGQSSVIKLSRGSTDGALPYTISIPRLR